MRKLTLYSKKKGRKVIGVKIPFTQYLSLFNYESFVKILFKFLDSAVKDNKEKEVICCLINSKKKIEGLEDIVEVNSLQKLAFIPLEDLSSQLSKISEIPWFDYNYFKGSKRSKKEYEYKLPLFEFVFNNMFTFSPLSKNWSKLFDVLKEIKINLFPPILRVCPPEEFDFKNLYKLWVFGKNASGFVEVEREGKIKEYKSKYYYEQDRRRYNSYDFGIFVLFYKF